MTSDVTLDSGQIDSAFSSPSQASEASSTAADRVFFGPILSPEKRFARRAGSAPLRTPVRRSTRLSSTKVPLSLLPQQQGAALEGFASGAGEIMADEDGIIDEPSVVLASRVFSAAANPSPPPTPPLVSQPEGSDYMDVQLLDRPDPPEPQDTPVAAQSGPLIPIEGISETIMDYSPVAARPTPPTLPPPEAADRSQPDLINFDSFSAQEEDEPAQIEARDQELLLTQSSTTTVDDLLAMSPNPQPIAPTDIQQSDSSQPHNDEEQDDATTPDDEMEVIQSLIIEVDPPNPADGNANNSETERVDGEDGETDAAPAPLRRSSRPRRSRNSLPQTVTTPAAVHPFVSNDEDASDSAVDEPPPLAQLSPARKRKLKLSPMPGNGMTDTSADMTTPRKLPQAVLVRRELGSLSPMSAAVLTQLLPKPAGDSASRSTTPQPQESEKASSQEPVQPTAPSTPPDQTATLVFPKVGVQVNGSATDIQRPKSPLRPFPISPFKIDETARTPARRVPISQAIAEGTFSAQKLPALFGAARPAAAPGSPVFKRLALDDPTRSPARRVPMSEAAPIPPSSPDKGKNVFRPLSPVRPLFRERQRSGSAEPRPPIGRKERGASAEPTVHPPALGRRPVFQKPASSEGLASSSLMKPRAPLPFPFAQSQRLPAAIPEVDEPGPSSLRPPTATARSQTISSPAKSISSLRQPSAGAGSKIPRIGAKPYARPKAVGKTETGQSKLPAPKSSVTSKPLRIVTVGSSSSGGSSDEGPAVPPPATKLLRRQGAGTAAPESSAAQNLKRKREAEHAKPATPAPQPVIVIRKVVPGMFNKGEKAEGSTPVATTSGRLQMKEHASFASPVKSMGPIKGRSAANWKRPQLQAEPLVLPSSSMLPAQTSAKAPTPERQTAASVPPPASEEIASAPADPMPISPVKETRAPTPPPPTSAVSGNATNAEPVAGPSTISNPAEDKSSRHRRSTRSRRSQEQEHAPTTDVFGTVSATSSTSTFAAARTGSRRQLPARRKPVLFSSETAGPFAGMSALALKTLTNANTVKNQAQVAVLTTEVVRKEGARPDSPTTKVRSALERQREERVVQRKERAERRARRSGGDELEEGMGAGGEKAGEGMSEAGDASFMSVDRDGDGVVRHRRGPGDEGDYETPPRPERPLKRLKFDGQEEKEEETEAQRQERRVKWDKGLHTTVYLDDSPPKPRRNKHAVPSQKGCLTPAAKALRLDTLGNVLNADIPVGGLVKENITVKKFVFDDDEAEAELQEPASPAPVKSTRSKSKKAKS
ncbi:hypothetical protein C2E23DRAFT_902517 [Lenzites betulinus]|nr:hypothetical protein C2E23DRAFT_902517 [Lenzites betulinus]